MKPEVHSASSYINADDLLNHIKILASDQFEGRLPGSIGEERTIEYLKKQCQSLGLLPGDKTGGFFQKVPVYGLTAKPALQFGNKSESLKLSFPNDFVGMSRDLKGEVAIENSDVVFVGYGAVAPEYGWDDYKGLDVRGKTVIMLIGDPSRPDPKNPAQLDESFFRGKAMTYYGRWTYKYEIASKLGASAVFIVHETEPAGYGYDVVTASWGQENFDLGSHADRVKMEGWLSNETARKLFKLGGVSFDEAKQKALRQDFVPIPLNAKASANVTSKIRKFESSNVVAMLPGSDPELKKECIVYSAHWDHFGTKKNEDGTTGVFSGALDNGSGVATILEVARAYSKLQRPPKRSIVFLFTTLEERGLLGSLHYVQSPIVSLE
jgi:Zn-dependent M28 family amino/carboxypeptidase